MWAQGVYRAALAVMSLLLVLRQQVSSIEIPDDPKIWQDLKQPPTIVKQSVKDYIVDPRDNIIIECEASGTPVATCSWRRNGRFFNVAKDPRVSMSKKTGTLEINFQSGGRPEDYEGEYQCYCANELGTALSNKILLRVSKSPLWPKEVLAPVSVPEGSFLVLRCNPPPGLPPPQIFWMNSAMMPIPQDQRVSMGLNGDLYFSNVLAKDAQTDYSCNARFPFTHTIQQKNPYNLRVQTSRRIPETLPTFLTPTAPERSSKMVLRGKELKLECIVAGYPTPTIKWFKKGGELSPQRVKLENFNKTLFIESVSEEDAGEYVCMANNKLTIIRHSIHVQVKAAPYWLDSPTNLVLAPDENGRLVCRANGNPKPHIQWLINGEPIETSLSSPSRQVMGDTIIFRSVQTGSSAVYQCNASNEHGYLLANALLSVLEMKPRMLGAKKQLIKVIENKRTFLDCPYFGSPLPVLRWFKNGQGSGLDGGYYRVYANGSLEMKRVRPEDQGTYTCVASNILGSEDIVVRLEVKEPTRIVRAPEHQSATRGSTVRFDCRVKHDASLPITITWTKDDRPLTLGWRIKKDEDSLTIPKVHEGDEGVYTCSVQTEIDQDTASARLTVLEDESLSHTHSALPAAVPDAPMDLELSDPAARSVRLTWIPGDNHNSPVTQFQVEFEEDRWEQGRWQSLSSFPGDLNSVVLQLSPFVNYQFRVTAVNAVGPSPPSRPSPRYQTSGAPPDVIPTGLRGWGTKKNNMEITWEPLLDTERNGPNLHYSVWWRRKDTEEEWSNVTVTEAKHVVRGTETYVPYEIKLQARNDFGSGPTSNIITGYSGEDKPTAPPTDLRVSKINSTKVTVHWTPVDLTTVLGEFKEYRVYYWREASLVRGLRVSKERSVRGFYSTVPQPSGMLTDLVPYSHYRMVMVVANRHHEGPASNTVEFQTKEGVPAAPRFFKITQRSAERIHLEWDKPLEPNGILIGYTLQFQTVNGSRVGHMQIMSFQPNVTSYVLRLPDRSTRYKFFLAARTQVGAGEVYAEESPHFTNEAYSKEQVDIATQGWFIGLMCAIALIILILLIVCFIKRSRGGKYPVRDKKDLPLDPVDQKEDGSFDYQSN